MMLREYLPYSTVEVLMNNNYLLLHKMLSQRVFSLTDSVHQTNPQRHILFQNRRYII